MPHGLPALVGLCKALMVQTRPRPLPCLAPPGAARAAPGPTRARALAYLCVGAASRVARRRQAAPCQN